MQGLYRVREGVQLEMLRQDPVEPFKLQHYDQQAQTPDFARVLVNNHHNQVELMRLQAHDLTLIDYNSFTQDKLPTAQIRLPHLSKLTCKGSPR